MSKTMLAAFAALFASILSPTFASASKGCVAGAVVIASKYTHEGTKGNAVFAAASGFRQTLTLPIIVGGKKAKLAFKSRSDDGLGKTKAKGRVTNVTIYGNYADFRGVNLESDTILKVKNADGTKTSYPVKLGVLMTKDLDGKWQILSKVMTPEGYPLFVQPDTAKNGFRYRTLNVSCGGFIKK